MAKEERPPRVTKRADDAELDPYHRILIVGRTGSGKTTQIRTLPGKKFAYIFDPNALSALKGTPDLEYVDFLPEFGDLDTSLKGFNTGSKSDKPAGKGTREPRLYEEWRDHFNDWVDQKQFENYNWLIFDSYTFISRAMMQRQLYINNRYGEVEERPDLKIVGAKLADVFSDVNGLPINIFATGHISVYEHEKTGKVETSLYLPGRARAVLPLTFTNVWEAQAGDKPGMYEIKTVPERKGLQDIRSSLIGLKPVEDVTVTNFRKAEAYGIGKLLRGASSGTIHSEVKTKQGA